MATAEDLLRDAIELAYANVTERGGRPFGAVVARDGVVIATGVNEIGVTGDPTAHAELQAIRAACRALRTTRLEGCAVYASGQPCPMCLAAMYLTGIQAVAFAYANADGERYGLSTAPIYAELQKPLEAQALAVAHVPVRRAGEDLYEAWARRP